GLSFGGHYKRTAAPRTVPHPAGAFRNSARLGVLRRRHRKGLRSRDSRIFHPRLQQLEESRLVSGGIPATGLRFEVARLAGIIETQPYMFVGINRGTDGGLCEPDARCSCA